MSPVPAASAFQHGAYTIQHSAASPLAQNFKPRTVKYSNVVNWCLWSLYVVFQLHFAHVIQQQDRHSMWRIWIYLLAEFCLSFQELVLALSLILIQFAVQETPGRPSYQLLGSLAPSIDVFVTCCGEPVDIIVDTVASVETQEYPSQQLRIFVLDDGRSEQLRDAVALWNERSIKRHGPQICYLSRRLKPGVKSYFKAGNLRFGIEETKRLGGSEFMASLDADMIPEPDWLQRLIPHLIIDDGLAMVCPPQSYYNVPKDDPLGQKTDFDVWFTIFEPLNDRLDAAMCTGTGYVVRRSALEDIGGWPLAEAAEDFMCSSTLSNAGWRVGFVGEALQHGLAPESLRAHVKQKQRWVDGGIEVHKHFAFYLPGLSNITSKMTWGQRAVGLSMAMREYAPVTNVISLLLLPLAFFPSERQGYDSVASEHHILWLRLRTLFLAAFLMHKLNDFILYGHIGLRRIANLQAMDIWCAPYSATRCMLSFLPSAMNPLGFESSGAVISSANERSRIRRKPLPWRLFSLDLLLYLLYIIYASVPVLLHFSASSQPGRRDRPLRFPFPGALIKLLGCIWKISVPLRYMALPPTVPERDELMEADERGGRRPKKRMGQEAGRGDSGAHASVPWLSWLDFGEMLVIWACYFG